MSDTLERELRRTLAEHAPSVPAGTDPWQRVQAGVVRRRRQRAGAVAGSLALVVAAGVGVAVVQPWAGGEPTQPATVATSGWALDDGSPRGDLGDDAGLRDQVAASLTEVRTDVSPDTEPVVDGSLRVVYAADVADTRAVLVVLRVGSGAEVAALLLGPAGAPGADLVQSGAAEPVAQRAPVVGFVAQDGDASRLVAVVPRGATASVSPAAAVGADGTLGERTFEAADVSGEGVVEVDLPDASGGVAVVRVDRAPGWATDRPVAEVGVPWPAVADADLQAVAQEVVARGPVPFRDGDVSRAVEDQSAVVRDVEQAMEMVGAGSADDALLLYASGDGADADRGASGWVSLVQVRAGDGAVVVMAHHVEGTATVVTTVTPTPPYDDSRQVLLRARGSAGTDLVGVWTPPEGGLGSVQVDGEEAFMPEALGLRWFPVPAGAEVVVDGEPVPPVPAEGGTSWQLLGEPHPGPDPQVGY